MELSEPNFIKRDGFWWPADDDWCWRVIHDEVPDIDLALNFTQGRDTCIQAGGNVGVWAAHLAQHFRHVVTAEPVAENFVCLKANVPGNVFPLNLAFGAAPGRTGMHMEAGNAGAHWIEGDGSIAVEAIDNLSLSACDLIILDVEGSECAALRGAEQTIRKFRPVVMFEEKGLGSRYYGLPDKAAQMFMQKLGYRIAKKVRKDVIMVAE